MDKKCPKFGGNCLKEECMAFVKTESVVPEGYPEVRLITYKDNKPTIPTKIIVNEHCKYFE